MLDILDSHLALRRDAVFMQTVTGILFRTRKGVFSFTGKSIYATFRRILPFLDGACSGTEILEAIGPQSRDSLSQFLQSLIDRDVLQPADIEGAQAIGDKLREAFSTQIEFIRHYADRPHERFLNFRNKKILLCGEGHGPVSAGVSLLRNGVKSLAVAQSGNANIALLEKQCDELQLRGVPATVSFLNEREWKDRLDFEVVIYCSETPDLSLIRRLNADATERGYYFLPAIIRLGKMVVGPIVDPLEPGCWQCAALRWADNASPETAADLWRELAIGRTPQHDRASASELQAHILGNTAALEVFKLCVGNPEAETRKKLLTQDLATLESSIKSILPHPDCSACLQVHGWAGTGEPPKDLNLPPDVPVAERSFRAWQQYTDPEYGVFRRFQDEDVEQIPLRLSILNFALPTPNRTGFREISATGISIESSSVASMNALRKAVGFQAANFAPSGLRRLGPSQSSDAQVIEAHRIYGWLGTPLPPSVAGSFFECTDLLTGNAVAIPAAALHSYFDTNGYFDTSAAGIGVGDTTDEALMEAVLSAVEQLTVRGFAEGTLAVWRWIPSEPVLSRSTRYLLSTIGHLEIDDHSVFVASPAPGFYSALLLPVDEPVGSFSNSILKTRFSASEAIDAVLTERIARAQVARCRRTWCDVPRQKSFYSQATFNLHVLPDEMSQQNMVTPGLDGIAALLNSAGWRIAWLDMTAPEVEMTRTFRVVKALLTQ